VTGNESVKMFYLLIPFLASQLYTKKVVLKEEMPKRVLLKKQLE